MRIYSTEQLYFTNLGFGVRFTQNLGALKEYLALGYRSRKWTILKYDLVMILNG